MALSSLVHTAGTNDFYRLTNDVLINYNYDKINLVNIKTNKIKSFDFWPGTNNAKCFVTDLSHTICNGNGHPMNILFYVSGETIWVIESKSTREKSTLLFGYPYVYVDGYLQISHYKLETFDTLWTHTEQYKYDNNNQRLTSTHPHLYTFTGFQILHTFCKKYMFILVGPNHPNSPKNRFVVINMETNETEILDETWIHIPNEGNSAMVTILFSENKKCLLIYDMVNGKRNIHVDIESIIPIVDTETNTFDLIANKTKGQVEIIKLSEDKNQSLSQLESDDKFGVRICGGLIEMTLHRQFDTYKGYITLPLDNQDTTIKTINRMYEIIEDAIHKRKPGVTMCYKIYDTEVNIMISVDMIYFTEEIEICLSNKDQCKQDVIDKKIEYLMGVVEKLRVTQ